MMIMAQEVVETIRLGQRGARELGAAGDDRTLALELAALALTERALGWAVPIAGSADRLGRGSAKIASSSLTQPGRWSAASVG